MGRTPGPPWRGDCSLCCTQEPSRRILSGGIATMVPPVVDAGGVLPRHIGHHKGLIRLWCLDPEPRPTKHLDVPLARPQTEDLLVDHLQESEVQVVGRPCQPTGIAPHPRRQSPESWRPESRNRQRLDLLPPLGPVAVVEQHPSGCHPLEACRRIRVDLERMTCQQAIGGILGRLPEVEDVGKGQLLVELQHLLLRQALLPPHNRSALGDAKFLDFGGQYRTPIGHSAPALGVLVPHLVHLSITRADLLDQSYNADIVTLLTFC